MDLVDPNGKELVQATASSEDAPVEIPLRQDRALGGRLSAAARTVQGSQDVWFESAVPLPTNDPLAGMRSKPVPPLHRFL
jgi:hypothetical protein